MPQALTPETAPRARPAKSNARSGAKPGAKPDGEPDACRADGQAARRDRRREALADAAIEALGRRGYANTSLRDIAAMSGLSLGALHYYFADKGALLAFCLARCRTVFLARLAPVFEMQAERDAVIAAICASLSASLRQEAATHRLWQDIRAQALFDPAFRETAEEIEARLIQQCARLLQAMGADPAQALPAYLALDGAFRQALQRQAAGAPDAGAELEANVAACLSLFRDREPRDAPRP